MARGFVLLSLVLSSLGCGGPLDVDDEGRAIVGGTSAAGRYPGVALLIGTVPGFRTFCTATMITPRVVLTAAHCVDETTSEVVWFADAYDTSTGEFEGRLDTTRRSRVAKWVHPRYVGDPTAYDIALLLLDVPAPAAAVPSLWSRDRASPALIGETLRLVGFGMTSGSDTSAISRKRHTTNTIGRVTSGTLDILDSTDITCQGDSGGPAFISLGERLIVAGVTSYGDPGCDEFASFTRVDLYLPEIRAFIQQHDPQPAQACVADGACDTWCAAPDPDCPCAGEGVCSEACPDSGMDPDCPADCGAGNACVRQGCPVKDPDCGEAPLGATCSSDNQCLSAKCHATRRVCAEACGAGGACPASFTCAAGNVCEAASEAGGCGCQAAPGSRGWWGGLLAAALALLWRRRATA